MSILLVYDIVLMPNELLYLSCTRCFGYLCKQLLSNYPPLTLICCTGSLSSGRRRGRGQVLGNVCDVMAMDVQFNNGKQISPSGIAQPESQEPLAKASTHFHYNRNPSCLEVYTPGILSHP